MAQRLIDNNFLYVTILQMVKQYHLDFNGQLETEFEFLLTPCNAHFILRDRSC